MSDTCSLSVPSVQLWQETVTLISVQQFQVIIWMGLTNVETNVAASSCSLSLMCVNVKLSSQKFLKCYQAPGEELSLPWCPAFALSTEVWRCLQCERKPDCSNTVEFHITNMSLQTKLKLSQPLEFALCAQQKVLLGLDLPGPGEGVPGKNVWNWRLEKFACQSSIFSCSEWLSKWKWFPRASGPAHELEQIAED